MATDYTLAAKVTGDTKSFDNAMSRVQGKLSSVKDSFAGFGKGLSSVGKALAPVTAGMGILTGAATKTSVGFVKLYESSQVVFEKMLGGKAAANDMYRSLLDIAKGSVFSQEAFLRVSKSLVGVGMSADTTKKTMKALTNAVSAFGGSSEDLERAGYAMRKMQTAGKVSMEELNMLMDAGVNGLTILANKYGVTTGEMRKMISKGAVPAKDAIDMLNDGIQNGTDGVNGMTQALDGMAQKMKGKTLTGALDSMKSSIRNFSLSLIGLNPTLKETDSGYAENQQRIAQLTAAIVTINQIIPLMTKLFSGVTEAIGTLLDKLIGSIVTFNEATGQWEQTSGVLTKLKETLDNIPAEKISWIGNALGIAAVSGLGFLVVGKALSTVSGIFSGLSMSAKALSGAFTALGAPMTIVLVAIGVLAGAFVYLMKTNETFRNTIFDTWGKISETIGGIVSGLSGIFSDALSNAKDIFAQLANALAPVIVMLVEGFGNVLQALAPGIESVARIVSNLALNFGKLMIALAPVIAQIVGSLVPIFTVLADVISQVMGALEPVINILVENLMEVITQIVSALQPVIETLAPAIIDIIKLIGETIVALSPVIGNLISIVGSVISEIISIITPIISFIAHVIAAVIGVITPIIGFIIQVVATILNTITGIIAGVTAVFSTVAKIISSVFTGIVNFIGSCINGIIKVVASLTGIFSRVFQGINSIVTGVFASIRNSWSGLTGFVNDVVSGISSAFSSLTSRVKSAVNAVIGGINGAIGIINKIPGVSISRIAYLARGTDNWQGGFARINEGGRGELVMLPGGTQVIPHDVSMKYAKESARSMGGGISQSQIREAIIEGVASLKNAVEMGFETAGNRNLVLDTGVLVGATSELMDEHLGGINMLRGRGTL